MGKTASKAAGGLKLAVIADDYTGAADTGIQFRRVAAPLYLLSPGSRQGEDLLARAGGVALSTDSRNAGQQRAEAAVRRAAALLSGRRPGLVYKKVDSCLRGNPGAEAAALLQALDLPAAFVTAAFPAMGRTTRDGRQLLHGVPVAKSEMANDPLSPVRHSRALHILAQGTGLKGGEVPLATVVDGGARLEAAVDALLKDGCRFISFDAVEQEHLAAIARLLLGRFPRAMPVGSAGLALGLAGEMPQARQDQAARPKRSPLGFLYVCGSASPRMAQQVAMLRQNAGCPMVASPAGPAKGGRDQLNRLGDELRAHLAAGAAVAAISAEKSGDSALALANLAAVVARAMDGPALSGMFLSGGDTAHAILNGLSIQALELSGEPVPGLVESLARGGPADGLCIITKAGAFGGPEALWKLYQNLFATE